MAKLSVDVAKFKSSDVRGIQVHNQREGEIHKNENIDPSRTELNYDLHNEEAINYNKAIKEIMAEGYKSDKAPRKDAVVMNGIAVQVNKEFFDNLTPEKEKEFFKTVYDTVAEKYGKQNIISANVHKDEKAPHIQINLVPLTADGRLCGKEVFDRKGLLNLHTDISRALQEREFDIQRGEPTKEKKQRISIHEHNINEKEKSLAEREQSLEIRTNDLVEKEKTVNQKLVGIARIEITERDVLSIQNEAKEKTTMLGKVTGDVTLSKDKFEKLITSAKLGAVAREDNTHLNKKINSLEGDKKNLQQIIDIKDKDKNILEEKNYVLKLDVVNLERKIGGYEALLNDRQISKRVQDIQNPHLAAYREIKDQVPRISYGDKVPERYEEIAYQMMKTTSFDKTQIQEALRTDLNRDKVQTAMSGAGARITQDKTRELAEQAKAQAEQERLQAQAQQEKARAEAQQKIIDQQIRIDKNPHLKKYQDYKKKNKRMTDSEIAFRMTKIDKIPEYKVTEALTEFSKDKNYASKVVSEVRRIKIPTAYQTKTSGVPFIKNIEQQLKKAHENSPLPSKDKDVPTIGHESPTMGGGGGGSPSQGNDKGGILADLLSADSKNVALDARCAPEDFSCVDWEGMTHDEAEEMQHTIEQSRGIER